MNEFFKKKKNEGKSEEIPGRIHQEIMDWEILASIPGGAKISAGAAEEITRVIPKAIARDTPVGIQNENLNNIRN